MLWFAEFAMVKCLRLSTASLSPPEPGNLTVSPATGLTEPPRSLVINEMGICPGRKLYESAPFLSDAYGRKET